MNRPGFAPETPERIVSKGGERYEPALNGLDIFAERSLHTGEAASANPTEPDQLDSLKPPPGVSPLITLLVTRW
jgi:hypothetical protein